MLCTIKILSTPVCCHVCSESSHHIKEEEDVTNNFNEFKPKSKLKLDAAGYWKYIDGLEYNSSVIPELKISQQIQGLDGTEVTVTITILGNEAIVAGAKKDEPGLLLIRKPMPLLSKPFLSRSFMLFVIANLLMRPG